MKNFLFYLLLLLLIGNSQNVNSQTTQFEWAKSLSTGQSEFGYSMNLDQSGNIYTLGVFYDNRYQILDFDPGPDTFHLNSSGIFVLKLDSSGEFEWAKNIEGTFISSSFNPTTPRIAISEGAVYLIGQYKGIVDFDPGLGVYNLNSGSPTISANFILKLSHNGDFKWVKSFNGLQNVYGISLAIDKNENVYTTGLFDGTVDFDPGNNAYNLSADPHTDIFISKLDSSGNFVWAKTISGAIDVVYTIKTDHDNHVYITGLFINKLNLNNEILDAKDGSLFIFKLNTNGDFNWVRNFGNRGGIQDIKIDSDGNIFGCGYLNQPDRYSDTQNIKGYVDMLLFKMDSTGNLAWTRSMHGIGTHSKARAYNLDLDLYGNMYVTGTFKGKVDFDSSIDTSYYHSVVDENDIFISKYNQEGNLRWTNHIGNSNFYEQPYALSVNRNGSIFTMGNYGEGGIHNWTDFDPGPDTFKLHTKDLFDIYILKLSQPIVDLKASTILLPSKNLNGCSSLSQSVKVLFKNVGYKEIDFSDNPTIVKTNLLNHKTNSTLNFTKLIDNNSLNSGKPLQIGDSILIDVANMDMTDSVQYDIVTYLSLAIDTLHHNDTISSGFITGSNIGKISGPDQVCDKGEIELAISNSLDSLDIQWQKKVNGNFVDINQATSTSIKYYIDTTTTFRAVVCNSFYSETHTVIKYPSVSEPIVKNDSLSIFCGESGNITLSANSNQSEVIYRWYKTLQSESPIAEGKTFSYKVGFSSIPYEKVDQFYVSCKSKNTICESERVLVMVRIKNIEKNPSIKVFPNPNKGMYTLEGKEIEEVFEVFAYNSRGRLVYKMDRSLTGNFSIPMDFSALSKGIYFLQFKGADSIEHVKVVVQ